MSSYIYIAIIVILTQITNYVAAHSGGTDQYGCHTESSTGIYHCHNSSGSGSSSNKDDSYDGADFAEFAYISHAVGAAALQFYFLTSGYNGEYSHIVSIGTPGIAAGIQVPLIGSLDVYVLSRFMSSTRSSLNIGVAPAITKSFSARTGIGYIFDSNGLGDNTDLNSSEDPQYSDFTMDIGLQFNIVENFGLGASYDLTDGSYWIDATYKP